MRVVVLGITGRTGHIVADLALERGMDVVALVRHEPESPTDPRVAVTVLDLRDQDAIAPELAGADAVVSAIGPVTGVTVTEVSEATQAVVDGMVRAGVRRIVAAANGKVLTDDEVTGEYANVAAEHRRDAAILAASGLDWTLLAAPFLTDEAATGDVAIAVDGKPPARSLTRADFAATLLDALAHDEWVGHIVGVANA
ncbi:MAG TPA: NAD(P)H-binding protein [Actinomycetota bacterium]|jgi:putative NADH-flavin reductase|nr:NAD(P)H-binding protein [Actinomycetota bacterium]